MHDALFLPDVCLHILFQANFDGILNLTAYACKEVYIVLGVVNKFGFSRVRFDRITLLPLEVHGGIYDVIIFVWEGYKPCNHRCSTVQKIHPPLLHILME